MNNSDPDSIRSCHCACVVISAVMLQVKTAVCKGFAKSLCSSSASKSLPCRKGHEPTLFGYVYIQCRK